MGGGGMATTRAVTRHPHWKWRRWRGFLYVLPWLIGFLAFQLFPFVASFAISFTHWDFGSPPTFAGLANYGALLHDHLVWRSLGNTIEYTALHVPGSILIAFLLALLL